MREMVIANCKIVRAKCPLPGNFPQVERSARQFICHPHLANLQTAT
jgi:hypothetical protein